MIGRPCLKKIRGLSEEGIEVLVCPFVEGALGPSRKSQSPRHAGRRDCFQITRADMIGSLESTITNRQDIYNAAVL